MRPVYHLDTPLVSLNIDTICAELALSRYCKNILPVIIRYVLLSMGEYETRQSYLVTSVDWIIRLFMNVPV